MEWYLLGLAVMAVLQAGITQSLRTRIRVLEHNLRYLHRTTNLERQEPYR